MAARLHLNTRTTPKPRIQINRSLIIALSAIITTILLFGIVGAFTHTQQAKKNIVSTEEKLAKKQEVNISPEIAGLPENYSNLENFFPKEKDDQRLEIILKQFEELQDEYRYLKRQFSEKEAAPIKKLDDEKTITAKKADLVFSSLGSNTENILAGDRSKSTAEETLKAGPAQEDFLKSEAENKRRLEVAKGKDRTEDIYDMHNIIKPISKYQIQAGTSIPAILDTGIETTVVGTIVAHVRSDVYDTISGKYLLIPKGSKLVGEYDSRTVAGQRRILMEFGRIIRPDGSSILLGRALGADAIGQSGISGNVDNHWARIIGAATISTILTVGAGIGSDNVSRDNYYPDAKQRGYNGAATAVNDVGKQIAGQALAIKPTIKVPPGREFNVMVRKDMVLEPFKDPYREPNIVEKTFSTKRKF